jgi:hypothetical protein
MGAVLVSVLVECGRPWCQSSGGMEHLAVNGIISFPCSLIFGRSG